MKEIEKELNVKIEMKEEGDLGEEFGEERIGIIEEKGEDKLKIWKKKKKERKIEKEKEMI